MARQIDLTTHTDNRGNLTVIEKVIPFDIKRIFYIYGWMTPHAEDIGIILRSKQQYVFRALARFIAIIIASRMSMCWISRINAWYSNREIGIRCMTLLRMRY